MVGCIFFISRSGRDPTIFWSKPSSIQECNEELRGLQLWEGRRPRSAGRRNWEIGRSDISKSRLQDLKMDWQAYGDSSNLSRVAARGSASFSRGTAGGIPQFLRSFPISNLQWWIFRFQILAGRAREIFTALPKPSSVSPSFLRGGWRGCWLPLSRSDRTTHRRPFQRHSW